MFFLMIRNHVLWECGKDCWTECSLVCSSADSSSDSCFWFSNILHSDLQLLICHETEVAVQIRTRVIIDYWFKFCVSANIIIVGICSVPATIKHCSNNRDSKKKVKYSRRHHQKRRKEMKQNRNLCMWLVCCCLLPPCYFHWPFTSGADEQDWK